MTQRISPIELGTLPELAEMEARIVAARHGRVSTLYRILLNNPEICHGWEQMLSAVRNKSSLKASLREMIILRVAVLNKAWYEFESHTPHAKKAGFSDAKIEALKAPVVTGDFDAEERAILTATDALTRDVSLSDEQFAPLRQMFNDSELVELMATIGSYNMVSRFLIAFGLNEKH